MGEGEKEGGGRRRRTNMPWHGRARGKRFSRVSARERSYRPRIATIVRANISHRL